MNPTIVYKDKGAHHRLGGTFSWKGVATQEALDEALADGWFLTMQEAIDGVPAVSDAPPTRKEMELKATELNIKFDGRTTDAKLLKMINEAV